MGYLALYMLHRRWKNDDGFSLFLKEAAKLSAGYYDTYDGECEKKGPDFDSSFDSDSETSKPDETSESEEENYSEPEIEKVDLKDYSGSSEEKNTTRSSNSKCDSDSELDKKSVDTSDSEIQNFEEKNTSDSEA